MNSTAPLRAFIAISATMLLAACGGGGSNSLTGPTTASISVPDPSTATSITYSTNIAPILQSDCTACHNSGTRSGGYDFTSYAGVLRAVTPGSSRSPLVVATQSGGVMYSMLRTSSAEKSATIRRWVVDFNAAQ